MNMEWMLVGTGFTGALTLLFLLKMAYHRFAPPPSLRVFFSPKGGCTEAAVAEIKKARKEVLVQAYSFTSKPIADALFEAKGRGVHVEILLDKSNEHETYTELGTLINEGLAPHIDSHHAIAHNKIIIIDGRTLLTGSFNFTHQAEVENAENLMIVHGYPDLLKLYHQNFTDHKAHCQAPVIKPGTVVHRKAA